jgi:hypothetical protein
MTDKPQQKTDLEKLAHIFAALHACDKVLREAGCDHIEVDGIPIKDWIADAKQDFC